MTGYLLTAAALVILGYIILMFNSIINLKNKATRAFADIDTILKQRNDELPALVETCSSYMKHEGDLFKETARQRSVYAMSGGIVEKIISANVLGADAAMIMMKSENYPGLLASESFQKLSQRLSAIETKLADFREAFNDAVNVYNIHIQHFPNVIIAMLFGFKQMEFLAAPEAEIKK